MYPKAIRKALADWDYCRNVMAGGFPNVVTSGTIDAIFVWGRAEGEWQSTETNESVLEVAARLLFKTNAKCIVIPGYVGEEHGQGKYGYVGPATWKAALEALNVQPHQIRTSPGDGHNTKTEMDDFLDLMEAEEWRTAIAVTLHSHAMRAMLGTVQSIKGRRRITHGIRIIPAWPQRFGQNSSLYGSQGEGPYPRHQWYQQEFDRIPRYTAQGDLASVEELKAYLQLLLM